MGGTEAREAVAHPHLRTLWRAGRRVRRRLSGDRGLRALETAAGPGAAGPPLRRVADAWPTPAMAERPPHPLKTVAFLKSLYRGTLAALDEELFDELVVSRGYGFRGGFKVCFVSDPAGVRQVLVEKFDNYPRVPAIRRLFEAEVGTGTLGSEGETWRRHRRVATPVVDARAVRKDVPALIEIAEAQADVLARRAATKNPLDMEWEAIRILNHMVNYSATGGDPRALAILKWLSKVPRKPLPIDIVPKPYWLARLLVRRKGDRELIEADALLRRLIGDRRSEGYDGPQDLLWRLAHMPDRLTGEVLSDDETRDEAASLIAAGDATVRPLTWIWYLFTLHPEVESRVHEEIDAVLGGRPARPEDMDRFPYLERVLDETMRLYPPIPFMVRKAVAPDEICGHCVPKGGLVAVIPYVIHRHRKLWDDPDRFDPDRFLADRRGGRPRLAFMPFSAGPRFCPGNSMAMTNLMISIVALARRFRFRMASEAPVTLLGGISLQPRGGMRMQVEERF